MYGSDILRGGRQQVQEQITREEIEGGNRVRKRVPEFTSERNEGVEILVNWL